MTTEIRKVLHTRYGGDENRLIQADLLEPSLPALESIRGSARVVYSDPPFLTGKTFMRRRPLGEKGWKNYRDTLSIPGYTDRSADSAGMIRSLTRHAMELLMPGGVFILHLDWHSIPLGWNSCWDVFGRENFINEIIWAYESGGRSMSHFSRKHDNILLFMKDGPVHFDITTVPCGVREDKHNHMRLQHDEDGRAYRSIRSGGKEYRYYLDEPVYPSDVWADIPVMQQKDPERTGLSTQKPIALLSRLLKPLVLPGDRVVDLCCGSGSTLCAAQALNCRFTGVDIREEMLALSEHRLESPMQVDAETTVDDVIPLLEAAAPGTIALRGLKGTQVESPEDALESWATGWIDQDTFHVCSRARRTRQKPALPPFLHTDPGHLPALLTVDVLGRRRVYQIRGDM